MNHNLGRLYMKIGKCDIALKYLFIALKIENEYDPNHHHPDRSTVLCAISETFNVHKEFRKAIIYAEEAENHILQFPKKQQWRLHQVYRAKGQALRGLCDENFKFYLNLAAKTYKEHFGFEHHEKDKW